MQPPPLTNTIWITQNTQWANIKKEHKELHIQVEDYGMYSDYDDTTVRIHIILRSAGRVDFEVDPKGPINKNVCYCDHSHY